MNYYKIIGKDGEILRVEECSPTYELSEKEIPSTKEEYKEYVKSVNNKKIKDAIKDADKALKEESKEPFIQTSLHIDEKNNFIAEQIYEGHKTMFCVYTNNVAENIRYMTNFKLGMKYVPHSGEEIQKKAILLPTKAEEYGTDEELDQEIKDYIHEWLDLPEDVLQFAVWNIKRSWVYERFHTLNYLRALGDTGQGKSRFLDTLGYIHYKPIATSGASTSAPVFRIIDKWRGTLIMDEADFQKSDEAQDMIKIINQGFEKGRYIMRCDKDKKNEVNFFDPFCPKILATRKTFEDKAVESRCITQVMVGTQRRDIKWNLNSRFWKQTETIRNKLLMWRFRNYFKINPDKEIDLDLGEIEPRVQQVVSSFINLFGENEKQLAQFKKFILNYQGELIEERRDSFEGVVVNAIHSLIQDDWKDISSKDIIERGNITNKKGHLISPRGLSSTLKALGFGKTELKRISGNVKRCIPLNMVNLEHLFERYGCNSVTFVTDVTLLRKNEKQSKIEQLRGIRNVCYNSYNVTEPITETESIITEIQPNSTKNIQEIIKHLSKNQKLIPLENALKLALNAHIKEDTFNQVIANLKLKGAIYEPRNGFIQEL